MAYYLTGDYYMSAAGDPGIFGSIFSGIKGAVGGLLSGGPLGAISGGIRGFTASTRPSVTAAAALRPLPQAGTPRMTFGQRIRTAGQALIPGGVEPGVGCPPGYHLDKQTQTKCVRNRRMNPGNARALRRAIRREASFVGLAKRTLRGSGYTFKRTGVAKKRRH